MNPNSPTRSKVLPLRVRLREETNKAILQAAEQVFGSQGLGGARMEDIAARAGVAVGTLYNHFNDRDALLSELIASRRQDLAVRLDDELRRSQGEGFERQLEGLVSAVLSHFEEHRPFLSILLEGEHARTSPVGPRGARPNAALLEVYKRVQQLVERGIGARALRNEPDLLPSFLMGVLRSVLARELYAPTHVPFAERAPQIVAFFLRGAERR
jgi:AcrR family transcriptional regulator